ncbi:enoyl-CoA hydratase/isomerase family protein [Rhodococcoides trifolii]|nr:enoyl-CoA hydratase/isomerase family protein [Rhodococcus trifolii]
MTALDITEADGIVTVLLNRPAQRNAIDAAMIGEIHELCADLEAEPRIAIITGGTEGVFAAGADIAQLRDRGRADALTGINGTAFERIRRLPMPTIAAIDGYALGGGAELTYACDIRIGTPRTIFGQPEPGLGITAGAGATFRLVRLVGESVAKHLLLAGDKLTADRAFQVGLLHSIVEPSDLPTAATALAQKMQKLSPIALRATKLVTDADPAAHPQVDLLAQAMLFTDDEKHRRMTEFLSRREPPANPER